MSAAPAPRPRSSRASLPDRPPVPDTLEGVGLSSAMLTDLVLRCLYSQGDRLGRELMETIRLPFQFVDDRLTELQSRRFVEVRGTSGPNRAAYHFGLTNAGRERAREALATSHYVGPAPVPLEQYRVWMSHQTLAHTQVSQESLREAFHGIVLPEDMFDVLGPAVNSARSLFLYGDPGNGKTLISETIAGLLGGAMFIPHALEVEGQIVLLHDPIHHHPVPDEVGPSEDGWLIPPYAYDRRYVRIKRPAVLVGGELTLGQLELKYDPYAKMYQAPFQLKANGGVLIIDDFGRQRTPPRDLLNRWIVPLEKRVDFLNLHSGGMFPVPFDLLLIFATNLAPTDLVEEAFLRRIHYKVHVSSPDPGEYRKIFRRCCEERGIAYQEAAVRYIYERFYERLGMEPRGCHPRDILDHLLDISSFLGAERRLATDLLDRACRSYFLDDIRKDL